MPISFFANGTRGQIIERIEVLKGKILLEEDMFFIYGYVREMEELQNILDAMPRETWRERMQRQREKGN